MHLFRIRIVHLLFGMLVLGFGVAAFLRNETWRSEVSLWSDVIAKSPGRYRGVFQLGRSLLAEGKYMESRQTYAALLTREQQIDSTEYRALLHHQLGVLSLLSGSTEDAVSELTKAISIRPSYPVARFNLAIAYERTGQPTLAEEGYRQAIREKPEFSEAYNNLGVLLANSGRIGEAFEAFGDAVRIRPDFSEAARNRNEAAALLRLQQQGDQP